MQKRLKKVCILGLCMMALVGSGACEKIQSTLEDLSEKEKALTQKKQLKDFLSLQDRVLENKATALDLYNYANSIRYEYYGYIRTSHPDGSYSTLRDKYLILASNRGSFSAQALLARYNFYDTRTHTRQRDVTGRWILDVNNTEFTKNIILLSKAIQSSCELYKKPNFSSAHPYNNTTYSIYSVISFANEHFDPKIFSYDKSLVNKLYAINLYYDLQCGGLALQPNTVVGKFNFDSLDAIYYYTYARLLNRDMKQDLNFYDNFQQNRLLNSLNDKLDSSQKQILQKKSSQLLATFDSLFPNAMDKSPILTLQPK